MKERKSKETIRLIGSYAGTALITIGLTLVIHPYLTSLYTWFFLAEPVDNEVIALLQRVEQEFETANQIVTGQPQRTDSDENEPDTQLSPEPEQTAEGSENASTEEEAQREEGFDILSGARVLKIPSIDVTVNVVDGVSESDLRLGPGFYPQSGEPGDSNVSIAGHRTTYGAPFRNIDKLASGDRIMLFYDNVIYVYHVDRVFVTHTRDWDVIIPTEEPALTLTTCHPPGWSTQRLIVRAYLYSSMSVD